MTKIYFDYTNMNVVNKLSSSISRIENASNTSCSIPRDFQYSSLLRKNLTEIKSIEKDLNEYKRWYRNCMNDFSNLEDELRRNFNLFSNTKVKKNKSLIK